MAPPTEVDKTAQSARSAFKVAGYKRALNPSVGTPKETDSDGEEMVSESWRAMITNKNTKETAIAMKAKSGA